MDATTEANLWPQIMQEAIAHQVVEVVNRVHKRNHSQRGISMAVVCAVSCGMDLNRMGANDEIKIDPKMTAMVEDFNKKYGNILGNGREGGEGGGGEGGEEEVRARSLSSPAAGGVKRHELMRGTRAAHVRPSECAAHVRSPFFFLLARAPRF
jgi:hypothetical protein